LSITTAKDTVLLDPSKTRIAPYSAIRGTTPWTDEDSVALSLKLSDTQEVHLGEENTITVLQPLCRLSRECAIHYEWNVCEE